MSLIISIVPLSLLLLLLLLLKEHSSAQKVIPDDLRKRIREAHTFDDLLSITQFSYAPHLLANENEPIFKDQTKLQPAEIRSKMRGKIKIYGASTLDPSINIRKSDFRQDIDDNTRKSLDILSKVRQGEDKCELQKTCIPILPENPDPGLLIFPRCYEVTQCIGSCCEFTEHCHPISIEYIQQPIVEMLYSGHNLFVINQTRNITIEQHAACSCRECSRFDVDIQCPQNKIFGPNCDCECRNREEKKDCQGPNKAWNDETCTCNCIRKKCYGGSILDINTCLCYHPVNK
uniref:PDGF_2 domain-containing protein n=1 Tax=Onchocerca volvulus TaxID=6282 RepID=A0A8R1TXY5_ONCVO